MEKIDAKYYRISKWDARPHVLGLQRRCSKADFVSSLSTFRISKSCGVRGGGVIPSKSIDNVCCMVFPPANSEGMEEDFPLCSSQTTGLQHDHSREKQKSCSIWGQRDSHCFCAEILRARDGGWSHLPTGTAEGDRSSRGISYNFIHVYWQELVFLIVQTRDS